MKTEKPNLYKSVMSRLILLLVIAALIAVAFPGVASAHAKLTASTPADGATVPTGLTQIAMTFAEETSVDQSNAQLLDNKGQAVAGATYAMNRADRTKMTVTTPPLADGTYTVKYKTVTEDDNGIVNGSFSFTVASAIVGSSVSAPSTPTAMTTVTTPDSTTTGATTSNTPQSPLPTTGAGDTTGLWATLLLASTAIVISTGLAVRKRSRL